MRDGRDGRVGERGPMGRPGEVGPMGRQGKSLFEIARENGFQGDADEFLKSLRGPKGDLGEKGADGLDGKDGRDGLDGLPGEKGDIGPKGRDGGHGLQGKAGDQGPRGPEGPQGPTGPMPEHRWDGTRLQFEKPEGGWGRSVDLKGPAGENGRNGSGGGSGGGLPDAPSNGSTYGRKDGAWAVVPGGGGGAVDSVNGQTGAVVLDAGDVGAATAAQGGLAESAVQPGDLSTVATTGAYADLSGKPTLGTAAAQNTTAFATAAQGALADTAVQPAGLSSYAPLASPALTGNPTAPTATAGDTDTSVATTAFVRTPSVQAVTSSATVTPTFSNDMVKITAQAAALALANPTGTAIPAMGIVIRIKDNGTARAISYDTQYRAIGVTLPTTTVLSKALYLGMIYNSDDTTWDVVSVAQQA